MTITPLDIQHSLQNKRQFLKAAPVAGSCRDILPSCARSWRTALWGLGSNIILRAPGVEGGGSISACQQRWTPTAAGSWQGWTDMAPVQESNRAGESDSEGVVGRKLQTMAQTHQDTRGATCRQGLLKESHQRTPREAQPEDMSSSGR